MNACNAAAALGDAREGGGRLAHGRHSLVRRDSHGADQRPLRIVVKPTASGKKWRATVDGEAICVSASPFVQSARILLEMGYPADAVIEMWHVGATDWALRGQLGAVAATVIDGEKVSAPAKNAPPVNDDAPAWLAGAAGVEQHPIRLVCPEPRSLRPDHHAEPRRSAAGKVEAAS
jgi:hypothetical protein